MKDHLLHHISLFLNFLLILYEFLIMPPTSLISSSFSIYSFPHNLPQKKINIIIINK